MPPLLTLLDLTKTVHLSSLRGPNHRPLGEGRLYSIPALAESVLFFLPRLALPSNAGFSRVRETSPSRVKENGSAGSMVS